MATKHNLHPRSKIRIKEDIMEEKNELNDIILNRGSSSNKSKKMILSIGVFALLLIIIVVVISSFSPNNSNLPQAVLPPEPAQNEVISDDPLFESVEVIDETLEDDTNIIDEVTKKIKEESLAESSVPAVVATIEDPIVEEVKNTKEEALVIVEEPIKAVPKQSHPQFPTNIEKPKTSNPAHVTSKSAHKSAPKAIQKGNYYVQVGSFSKSKPDAKLINDIKSHGFSYTFQKINRSGKSFNKVLVGPFKNEAKARKALKVIRKNIINGAFLTKV